MSLYTDDNSQVPEMQENLELLSELPQFGKLPSKALKLLAFLAERVTYDAGDTIFDEGDDFRRAYIVLEGQLELVKKSGTKAQVISYYGEKDVLGTLAILGPMIALFTLKAETRSTVLTISRQQFSKVLDQFPETGKIVIEVFLKELYQWERKNITRAENCCLKRAGATLL